MNTRPFAMGFLLAWAVTARISAAPAAPSPPSASAQTNCAPSNAMVLIPAGSFLMGDTLAEGATNEVPSHAVYLSQFTLDAHVVTRALWEEVHQWAIQHHYEFANPGSGKALNHPVQKINWFDAVKWCNARSEREGRLAAYYSDAPLTQPYRIGQRVPFVNWRAGYRLPTEAEWEKAARGGLSGRRFPWGETITHQQANYYSDRLCHYDLSRTRGYHPAYNDGASPYTCPVGSFAPNDFGVYDLVGNVREWCWDWFDGAYYASSPRTDPRGPDSGTLRVQRGGSWFIGAPGCRLAGRNGADPAGWGSGLGFRCALPAPAP